jgi:hypothetical protein
VIESSPQPCHPLGRPYHPPENMWFLDKPPGFGLQDKPFCRSLLLMTGALVKRLTLLKLMRLTDFNSCTKWPKFLMKDSDFQAARLRKSRKWKQIQFPKHCVFWYVEFQMMDKVQKPSDSEVGFCLK